jgi:hypothetical protein
MLPQINDLSNEACVFYFRDDEHFCRPLISHFIVCKIGLITSANPIIILGAKAILLGTAYNTKANALRNSGKQELKTRLRIEGAKVTGKFGD